MCDLIAAERLVGVTGVLAVPEGAVWTDGTDEVEQEQQSMMHPATKAGNQARRRQGFCAFLEAG